MTGLLLAALLLLALAADAEPLGPYEVGETLAPFALEDQHGVTHRLDEEVALILFSRDMDGGDLLKQALEEAPEGFLESRRALYVADISRMPGLVARLFAIPSMRKRPYAMLLDRTGSTTERFPHFEGRATILTTRRNRLTAVQHLQTSDQVRAALGLSLAPDAE